jgi:hypothetical protein
MGKVPKAKTERNRFIYSSYKDKGAFSKADREWLMKKFNINSRRIYQIIQQEKRKLI